MLSLTEIWYSKGDVVEVEYSVETERGPNGLPEKEIIIYGISVMGCEIKPKDNQVLVAKLKEQIRERL